MELRTDRLTMREFREDDWPALHDIESREDVARYQEFVPRTRDESRTYVLESIAGALQQPRLTYDLAMTLTASDEVIGRIGLGITDPEIGEAILWYTLHPDHWGQGFTTEAARAMVDAGFRELGLHRIWADSDPRNLPSWRVLEKIGMRREGHLIENAFIKGEWVDSFIYALLAREWAHR